MPQTDATQRPPYEVQSRGMCFFFPIFLYEKFITPLKVTFIRYREASLKKLAPTDTTVGRTAWVVRGKITIITLTLNACVCVVFGARAATSGGSDTEEKVGGRTGGSRGENAEPLSGTRMDQMDRGGR